MQKKPLVTYEEVERKRRDFARTLREFVSKRGRNQYHNAAPELPAEKLAGCEILSSRLTLLDRLPKNSVIAEIGTSNGDFSVTLLEQCAPQMLHMFGVEADRLTNPRVRSELSAETPCIKPHPGDASSSLAKFPDAFFDLIYINGDHDYAAVHRDIAMAAPKLKPTGGLVLHAYTTWSAVSMYHCGVARAVHEFCLENPWKFHYLALETMMYNDVMLTREVS
jgi:predicted O-methyltransferase YrrM